MCGLIVKCWCMEILYDIDFDLVVGILMVIVGVNGVGKIILI